MALDISPSALEQSLTGLAGSHPNTAHGGHLLRPQPPHRPARAPPTERAAPRRLLSRQLPRQLPAQRRRPGAATVRQLLAGGPLLLGLDQPRDPTALEAAYDDAAGVSAAFARNLLSRLNRDLQGTIDPQRFAYQAVWQESEQRIEMALVSRCEQSRTGR